MRLLTPLVLVLIVGLAGCARLAKTTIKSIDALDQPDAPRAALAPAAPVAQQDGINVYFSPAGGCTDVIVQRIGQAISTVDMQAFTFTSAPIARALLDAHGRGVRVRFILDQQERTTSYTSAKRLSELGLLIAIDDKHRVAHNKVILIDGRTVITGSFNFTKAAEGANAENLLVIEDKPDIAAAYQDNFDLHLEHSIPYDEWRR